MCFPLCLIMCPNLEEKMHWVPFYLFPPCVFNDDCLGHICSDKFLVNMKNLRLREILVTVWARIKFFMRVLQLPCTWDALLLWARCFVCLSEFFGISDVIRVTIICFE